MYRRAAELADRILRGTKPTDLLVEQSTKFELAAKALGVDVPISMQLLADEVIE
jgi:putative ABC transport system substrate-binding protein